MKQGIVAAGAGVGVADDVIVTGFEETALPKGRFLKPKVSLQNLSAKRYPSRGPLTRW
jgi:hypothetical protein